MTTVHTKGATPCINHCAFSTETGRRDALFGDEYGNTVFILHTSIKELLGHFRHIIRCLCLYVQVDVLFSLEKREQEKGMQRGPGTRTVPLHWEMPPKLKGQNQAHPIKQEEGCWRSYEGSIWKDPRDPSGL